MQNEKERKLLIRVKSQSPTSNRGSCPFVKRRRDYSACVRFGTCAYNIVLVGSVRWMKNVNFQRVESRGKILELFQNAGWRKYHMILYFEYGDTYDYCEEGIMWST